MEQQKNVPLASSREILPARPISIEDDQIRPSDEGRSLVSTEHDAPENVNEDEIESESNEKAPDAPRHTSHLARSKHALTIFTCYAVLSAFTWICTCIMVYRPLTTKRYGYGDKDKIEGYVEAAWPDKYLMNEHLYLAIRFLQAVVAVLIIPTTSTICAQGAIIFMQRNKHNAGLTLRQTMVLADKGWMDLGLLHSILHEGWERFGSRFLIIAVALNVLGFTISPLQQLFVRDQTILVPTNIPLSLMDICDITDHFADLPVNEQGHFYDDNLVTVFARAALASTTSTDPQMRLWQGTSPVCVPVQGSGNTLWAEADSSCTQGGATLVNVADLLDPFISQVPTGFNTGLIKQFAPRINSTATVDNSAFPENCQNENNSFYVAFNYSVGDPRLQGYMEFSMEACMPGDQTQPKWNATRSRQDFKEELYLKIFTHSATVGPGLGRTSYRIAIDTTAGFFELPNYAHTEPGPLLENGPLVPCGQDCYRQVPDPPWKRQATTNTSTMIGLESVPNKGPLLTIALALFGESSFIADRFYNWNSYIIPRSTWKISQTPYHCQEMVPFAGLMIDPSNGISPLGGDNSILNCASNMFLFDKPNVYRQIFDYLQFFQVDPSVLSNSFTAAAFLANEAWLLHPSARCSLQISLDHGTESHKPNISLAGIITISLLLAVFLLSLFGMALYSSYSPRWTSQLNSFAMIRIDASISDQVSLKYVNNVDDIRSIDKISGTMGGEVSTADNVEDLRLGALQPLSKDNLYNSMDRKISQDERFAMVRNHSLYYDAEEGKLRRRPR